MNTKPTPKQLAAFMGLALLIAATSGHTLHAQQTDVTANKPAPQGGHPDLLKAIKFAKASQEKCSEISGYRAVFTKKEVIGRKAIAQQMEVKIRRQPFSVYMKFVKPYAGREIVFTEGKNNGRMTVHLTGIKSVIMGELNLAPNDPQAMAENRHQITSMGMERTVASLIKQWEMESKYQGTEVKYYREAKINGQPCRVIEAIHAEPRRQFKFHKSRLYVDSKSGLPVRVEQFGFPASKNAKPPIIEQYTYSQVQPNIKLADIDFSTRNPKYGF